MHQNHPCFFGLLLYRFHVLMLVGHGKTMDLHPIIYRVLIINMPDRVGAYNQIGYRVSTFNFYFLIFNFSLISMAKKIFMVLFVSILSCTICTAYGQGADTTYK